MAEGPGARAAPWLLAAAVVLGYAGAFGATWQFDDWNAVVDDPRVQSLGAWWRAMPGIRPLLKLSFALDHQAGLGRPWFQAVNVAIHAGCAALAYGLLRRLEALAAARTEPPSAASTAAPFLAALLFALHPAQVEAVTMVSGRSTSLAALLSLASAVTWLDGRAAGTRWRSHLLSPLLLAAALGVKEAALSVPPALLAAALAGSGAPARWWPRLRSALAATAVHWAVLGLAAAAALASPTYRRMVDHALTLRPPGENLRVQLAALRWLCGQALWPAAPDPDPWLPAPPDWTPALVPGGLLVAGLVAWALASLRRRPAPALAALWTLLWLAPTGWWLPRPEPAVERHLYLALLGPAWLAARALSSAWRRAAARPLGPARAWRLVALALATGLPLLALAGATARRQLDYRDEVTFWAAAVRASPANPRAYVNLGVALAGCGRAAEAEAAFDRALALDPGSVKARIDRAFLLEGVPLTPPRAGPARCPEVDERR